MSRETKATKQEREKAINMLREFVKPGMTVYTTLRHRASSGMFRVIDLHVIIDNEPRWIGYTAATVMGDRYDDRRQGIKASGCGMDMGFHLVYNLSRTLFQGRFGCIGEGCPSNDHSNGDRDYTPDDAGDIRWTEGSPYKAPHAHRHSDGGYALRHRWM